MTSIDEASASTTDNGVEVAWTTEHVVTVTFSRPPHNFFDVALVRELADTIHGLGDDRACRAIILRSVGKHFCAGAKLIATDDGVSSMASGDHNPLYEHAIRLASSPVPVIAAVQGAAIGGGLGLALTADFRVAAPEARFAASFARLGLHQGFGISASLPHVVGPQKALELLTTGRRISGADAFAMGLCDRLVPLESLFDAALELAEEISQAGPLAVRRIRATLRAGLIEAMGAATAREHREQVALRETWDYREGVRASEERRATRFEGR